MIVQNVLQILLGISLIHVIPFQMSRQIEPSSGDQVTEFTAVFKVQVFGFNVASNILQIMACIPTSFAPTWTFAGSHQERFQVIFRIIYKTNKKCKQTAD